MITILSTVISILAFRFRRRASLELELIGLRHQVSVLRRQHPGRIRLFSTDRLLWVWLYRVWPQVLNALVLVKPATVVQWHRKGFRIYWRWRSSRPGRPKMSTEIRDLIRRLSLANPLAHERVREDALLFYILASASFLEITSDLYTRNLVEFFRRDSEVIEWLENGWESEELQHGAALKRYVETAWPEFDWDATYRTFLDEFGWLCSV